MNTELELREMLETLLMAASNGELEDAGVLDDEQIEALQHAHVDSFDGAGLLTSNEGLVLRLRNGAEFQVTIVQRTEARS